MFFTAVAIFISCKELQSLCEILLMILQQTTHSAEEQDVWLLSDCTIVAPAGVTVHDGELVIPASCSHTSVATLDVSRGLKPHPQ